MPRKIKKVHASKYLGDEYSSSENDTPDESVDHVSPTQKPTSDNRRSPRIRSANQQDASNVSETSQRQTSQSTKSVPKNASSNREKTNKMPRKATKVHASTFLGDERSSSENDTPDESVDHVFPTQKPTSDNRRSPRIRSANQQDTSNVSETSQRQASQSTKSVPKKAGANASQNREKSGASKRKQASPKKSTTGTTSKQNTSSRSAPRGLKTLKEVVRLQLDPRLQIPRLPFSRVIREVLLEYKDDLRITAEALQALQESSEVYLTHLLSDAYKCTMHRRAVTLEVRDVRIARYLRGPNDPGNP